MAIRIPIGIQDVIRVRAACRMVSTEVDVMLLVEDLSGQIRYIYNRMDIAGYPSYAGGAISPQASLISPGVDGYIIDARVMAADVASSYPASPAGQLVVGVDMTLWRNGLTPNSPTYRLVSGLLVCGGVLVSGVEAAVRPGLSFQAQPSPGPGANFTFHLAQTDVIRLSSVRFTLAADASVPTRRPHLQWLDASGALIMKIMPNESLVAGSALTYQFALGIVPRSTATIVAQSESNLPDLWLADANVGFGGGQIRIVVDNLSAGDQLSGIHFAWEQHYNLIASPF